MTTIKEFTMSCKIITGAAAAAALLASTALASAQTQAVPRYWGGGYGGYFGYGGYYGQAYPLGDGIGVYNYAPGPGIYVYAPGYTGWSGW
jgi:hypothetical protein